MPIVPVPPPAGPPYTPATTSTFTLQQTVNYAQTCIRMAPLTGIGGNPTEPAFSMGNWVRQFILGSFSWRWNRGSFSFPAVQGTQDYGGVTPLGFIETGSISNGTQQWQLELNLNLAQDLQQSRPRTIAPLIYSAGTTTYRLLPVPDGAYTVNFNYQIAAPNFENLTDTWAPIPDYLYYMVLTGFLAKTYEYIDNERFAPTMSLFVKQVIAANAGYADTQNNIFAQEFINSQREVASQLGNSQSGRQGRGLFGQ